MESLRARPRVSTWYGRWCFISPHPPRDGSCGPTSLPQSEHSGSSPVCNPHLLGEVSTPSTHIYCPCSLRNPSISHLGCGAREERAGVPRTGSRGQETVGRPPSGLGCAEARKMGASGEHTGTVWDTQKHQQELAIHAQRREGTSRECPASAGLYPGMVGDRT